MRINGKYLLMIGVLAVFGIALAIATSGEQPGTRVTKDNVVTQVIAGGSGNATANFPLRLQEGDAEHEAAHIFEALQGAPGVVRASLDISAVTLAVEYDSAVIDEGSIRARLVDVGYVAPSSADATPAELSADGKKQRIAIADDHGFTPAYIRAKAGVPLDLEFAPGTECRTSIKIPDLGVESDISSGAVVSLPALEAGTYAILCSGDAQEGAIIVE